MDDELLAFNGVDGESGGYLFPEMTVAQVAALARGEKVSPQEKAFLEAKATQKEEHYGLIAGLDCRDMAQSGWGVIFAGNTPEDVREALRPLLELRQRQAAAKDERLYREYSGESGYQERDTKFAWAARNGAGGAGAVDPKKMPYYLLIVGDPETIPYRFQHQLDVQYAVGRIYFDTAEEYARYAHSVVAAETGKIALARQASFFAVANPDDKATRFSSTLLAAPLAEFVRSDQPEWSIGSIPPAEATRDRLARLLGGEETPAFLFTASHGMGFRNGHSRQLAHTGAIVCQDWPGPAWKGDPRRFYFAGEDLPSDARLAGLVAMFFACYGGGSPHHNEFAIAGKGDKGPIAPRAFLAELPRRMLAHPKGGALAVIGHVDRAWDLSFRWKKSGPQLEAFQSTLKQMMEGFPVGAALEFFNTRYAELSSLITSQIQAIHDDGFIPDNEELAGLWTANNDARNYALIGDPAVRLAVAANGESVKERVATMVSTTQKEGDAAASAPPASDATNAMLNASSQPQAAERPAAGSPTEFGLLDTFKESPGRITATLQQIVEKIGTALEQAVSNVATLEVTTYVSDNIAGVSYREGRLTGGRLRAFTRIGPDGDMQVCVPERDGIVDDALWKIHNETLERAISNRAEMVKLAASAVSSLLEVLKK